MHVTIFQAIKNLSWADFISVSLRFVSNAWIMNISGNNSAIQNFAITKVMMSLVYKNARKANK